MTSRFVNVPADRLLGELRAIGAAVTQKGGRFVEGVSGHEIRVDIVPPGGRAMVRVLTSLSVGGDSVRGVGEDAVRLFICVDTPEGLRKLGDSDRINRTAPAKGDRVGAFLDRLRARLRAAYAQALAIPPCPQCGRPMAKRESKTGVFWGCSGYPACRGTREAAR